jgi:hypothetical protein
LVPQGDGTEAQVTWEDQQNINRFGRLNNRLHELQEEIKLAKVDSEPSFFFPTHRLLVFALPAIFEVRLKWERHL